MSTGKDILILSWSWKRSLVVYFVFYTFYFKTHGTACWDADIAATYNSPPPVGWTPVTCLPQYSPTFLAQGTSFMEDNFSTDKGGEMVSRWFKSGTIYYASTDLTGGGAQMVMWGGLVVNTDKASLVRLTLSSCCVAQFLTGHGLAPVWGLGVGDPWL